MVSTHPSGLATRQLTKLALVLAWAWSAIVLVGVGVIVLTTQVGVRALLIGSVPLVLCVLATTLLSVEGDPTGRIAAAAALFVCGVVLLVALISFIVPALVVVPTCGALIAACSYRLG
jgi:hypothetical protein